MGMVAKKSQNQYDTFLLDLHCSFEGHAKEDNGLPFVDGRYG
jgi:hypothetical protein